MRVIELPQPCLMLITGPIDDVKLVDVVRQAALGGVNVVQVRDRSASAEGLAAMAARIASEIPDMCVIVNGRLGTAQLPDVCGVHLPESGIRVEAARTTAGPHGLVGRSVHSPASAQKAAAEGADYLVLGTIYASGSHPEIEPAGPELLRQVAHEVDIPVIAIGGITPENAPACVRAGAAGIAVLSGIMRASDPRAAAARYWNSMMSALENQDGVNGKRRDSVA